MPARRRALREGTTADSQEPVEGARTEDQVGRQWPAPLRSMRHRDFRRFWFGLIVSVVGTWMQMAAQAWLVYELTDSPLALGLVGACGTCPVFIGRRRGELRHHR